MNVLVGVIIFLCVLNICTLAALFFLVKELSTKVIAGSGEKYTQIIRAQKEETPKIKQRVAPLEDLPDNPTDEQLDTMFPERGVE